MGFKHLELKIPVNYSESDIHERIRLEFGVDEFSWEIVSKSLDARKKGNIYWLIRLHVFSPEIKGADPPERPVLSIPFKKRKKKVLVVGSGPAGFFSAYVLQKAGFNTVIVERGSAVRKRNQGILYFEKTGKFNPVANYSFGEGGAGTFSDGKLTSRSKHISLEKSFILDTYIEAGAPPEIAWLAHPHVGTDFLKRVVENLRKKYLLLGGEMLFETMVDGLRVEKGKVVAAMTSNGELLADYFLFAPGHSSYETYRMLIHHGVGFRTKNFAIGSRAEHLQSLINKAQWGVERLEGLKAAEYRLSSPADGKHSVYSFCMCPGGIVVPATSYAHTNIVNGMSYYRRAGKFANAACVAGVNLDQVTRAKLTALECIDWLEGLEKQFFDFSGGYKAPFCSIENFIKGQYPGSIPETSYPLGLKPAPLWDMLPLSVTNAMREGLKDFSRKISGYDKGILIGLESKTSSPIQAVRHTNGLCEGFDNLFIAGEGSGYAGGIISSAADGIKVAMQHI
jgi:uncharacterized protein